MREGLVGGFGRLGLAAAWVLAAACQEPNPDFDGPASGASSSSGDGTTSTTTAEPMTTTGVGTGSMTTSGSDTMPPLDDGSSGPGSTTDPDTSGSSSSSGGENPLYPPCVLDGGPECTKPYEECYDSAAPEFTVCTIPCDEDSDCPEPSTGNAEVVCAGQGNDQCLLDCSGGATCPDGMECQQVGPGGMFNRCLWSS
ncbi:hypothetical protein [Paraliomyxa miuraensis]|uniref:hypothetical protein n=1 Tax=Paraliomyxa miuraensis TaxID=376150 RepID=UPI00225957B4|nr:hypothetical protein [Paraliomyxa miuraensis]MCX4247369.1 hypothetical protein [Paraliomyxa miuraensis]